MLKDTKLAQKPDVKNIFTKGKTYHNDPDKLKARKRNIIKSLKFYLNILQKLQIQFGYDDNHDVNI